MGKVKNVVVDMSGQMNVFQAAVLASPDVSYGYCKGLKALKNNSSMLKVSDTRKLQGSVDIDESTKKLYPEDARWDYAVGYGDKAYFVEVHPANTSNVSEIINKASWLEWWLKEKAKELGKIRNDALFWIPTGKVAILPNSPKFRQLACSKIFLTKNPFEIK